MKRLLIMRHAKSDWTADYRMDLERPLAPRGRRAARAMGAFLTRAGLSPDRVLCSPAERARGTVELAAEAGGWSCPVEVASALYGATPEAAIAEVRRVDEGVAVLLLAGHEPTWSELASRLAGGGRLRLPTAAVACLRIRSHRWSELDRSSGELAWLLTPKLVQKGFGGA